MERLQPHWLRLKSSLWFFPGLLTLAGIVLALITVRIDQAIDVSTRVHSVWLAGGGVDGARGVLGAIAGTTVGVAGTVFSIMVVALQLASNQFTPRVLRAIMQDRVNQITLGAFLGTFTYSLLVLRSVRSGNDLTRPFVPSLSVSIAFVLALTCMALLIYFIHHSARSMEASTVIDRVTTDAKRLVNKTFPEESPEVSEDLDVALGSDRIETILSTRTGYLVAIAIQQLVDFAAANNLLIRIEVKIGEFMIPGRLLATVWGPSGSDTQSETADEAEARAGSIRRAFQLLDDPSERDDLLYNMQRLADIALKAMSPGINDPTTARFCVDQIADVLGHAGRRSRVQEHFADADGYPRVIWRHDPWPDLVMIGFDQLSHYSSGDLQVMLHLSAALELIEQVVPGYRRGTIRDQGRLLVERGQAGLASETERIQFARATAWVGGTTA